QQKAADACGQQGRGQAKIKDSPDGFELLSQVVQRLCDEDHVFAGGGDELKADLARAFFAEAVNGSEGDLSLGGRGRRRGRRRLTVVIVCRQQAVSLINRHVNVRQL